MRAAMALSAWVALACGGALVATDVPESGPRIVLPPAYLTELDSDDIGSFPHFRGLHELPYWLPDGEQMSTCERNLLSQPAPRGPHAPLRRMGMQFEGITIGQRRFLRIEAACPEHVTTLAEFRTEDPPRFPGDGQCAVCAYCDPASGAVGACGRGQPH